MTYALWICRWKKLESLIKQGLLKSAKTCILEFYEHYVLRKHTRVKFDTVIHNIEGIFYYVHFDMRAC